MKKVIILSVIVGLMTIIACSKSSTNTNNNTSATVDCNTIDSRFSAVVLPIIQNNCSGGSCHSTGTANGPGPLTNFTQIKAAAASIKTSVESGSMPKNGVLTTAQKNAISCWVSSGAQNN
ncbi:MAG: hypothetical protein RL596_910 [Bacteroidota bacterium]|jgi:hypothetical protein